jgi:hypothetical protein
MILCSSFLARSGFARCFFASPLYHPLYQATKRSASSWKVPANHPLKITAMASMTRMPGLALQEGPTPRREVVKEAAVANREDFKDWLKRSSPSGASAGTRGCDLASRWRNEPRVRVIGHLAGESIVTILQGRAIRKPSCTVEPASSCFPPLRWMLNSWQPARTRSTANQVTGRAGYRF